MIIPLVITILMVGGVTPLCVVYPHNPCYNDPEPLGCFPIQVGGPFCHQLVAPQDPRDILAKFYMYVPELGNSAIQEIDFYDGFLAPTISPLQIDMNKELWVLIHGFGGEWPKQWMFPMKDALIKKGKNVLLVRWTTGSAGPNYPQATANTRVVGAMVARILTVLQQVKSLDFNKLTMVGFSLGAHVAGAAGATLFGNARRIIGIDPAGPLFTDYDPISRLDATDARFVQAIHCNGEPLTEGGFGTLQRMAHADFYANGGLRQPGCPPGLRSVWNGATHFNFTAVLAVACSHTRCPYVLTTSILDADPSSVCQFKGFACRSSDPSPAQWNNGECFSCGTNRGCPIPGYSLDLGSPHNNGVYYFNTEPNNATEAFFCGQQYKLSAVPTVPLAKDHGGNISIRFFYDDARPALSPDVLLLSPEDTLSFLTEYGRILVAPPQFLSISAIEMTYNPGPKTKTRQLEFAAGTITKANGQSHSIRAFSLIENTLLVINTDW